MSQDAYWRIFAEEVPSDMGVTLTPEQINDLTDALVGAHENYGLGSGRDVADANWRASEDRRLEQRGLDRALEYIESRVREIDSGPSRCFDAMTGLQRRAMHEIFQVREFMRKGARA